MVGGDDLKLMTDATREHFFDRLAERSQMKQDGRLIIPESVKRELEVKFSLGPDDKPAKPAEVEVALTPSRKKAKSKSPAHSLRIFDPIRLDTVKAATAALNRDDQKRIKENLEAAGANDGFRKLPNFRGFDRGFDDLLARFGNFGEALEHFRREFILAKASKLDSFRIAPVLLDGLPGVGKTAFALALADAIGLPFRKISAGGVQHASIFTGTAAHWANSQPGEVFNLLARHGSASAVLLIDEVDKLPLQQEYGVLPALLDLLEPESARRFVDESLGLQFDASRLIILMTSNRTDGIDAALRSRLKVFDIPLPGRDQKMQIALSEHEKLNLNLRRGQRIGLDHDAVKRLVDADMDVRALISALRAGFMAALEAGERVSKPIRVLDKNWVLCQLVPVVDSNETKAATFH